MDNSSEDRPAGDLRDGRHRIQARIYYADTDFSGFVYHGRYLEFFERGRIEYFRKAVNSYGGSLDVYSGLAWVVRHLEMRFRHPARVDDMVTIETVADALRGASVGMTQSIRRGSELLVEARFECALINSDGRPQRLPGIWKALVRPHDQAERDGA